MKIDWKTGSLSTEQLSPSAREAFNVPATFPFSLNGHSMVHYAPLFSELTRNVHFENIIEVGVFEGELSRYLIDLAKTHNANVDFVDVLFKAGVQQALEESAGDLTSVRFHERDSRAALSAINQLDLVFLDGDHNYETVAEELRLISVASGKRIVILHDVGWPCSRRDISEAPSCTDTPSDFTAGEITPLSSEIVNEFGLAFEGLKRWEGGPKNGVLTAVEDFLAEQNHWHYWSVPLFFGLGVLWRKLNVTDAEHLHLLEVGQRYTQTAPLLGVAELNRLLMLIRLHHDRKTNLR